MLYKQYTLLFYWHRLRSIELSRTIYTLFYEQVTPMHLLWIIALIVIPLFISGAVLLTYYKQDFRVLDTVWPLTFVLLSGSLFVIVLFTQDDTVTAQHFTANFLILWGIRQTIYIHKRKKRFLLSTRNSSSSQSFSISFIHTIFKESMIILALSAMVIIVMAYPSITSSLYSTLGVFIGSTIVVIGFIGEIVSDQQLRNFKYRLEMEGRIIKTGLWRYTRHPNYFAETLMWWGLFIIVFTNTAYYYNIFALISPLFMTWYSRFSQRIKNNETHLKDNKEYQAYKKRTSVFLPWFHHKTK